MPSSRRFRVSSVCPLLLRVMLGATLLGACAFEHAGPGDDPRERGAAGGKADSAGSCAGSDCSGEGTGGDCWCDEQCEAYGDCCDDKRSLCDGGPIMATLNVGLAYGAVPYAEQRLPHVVDALATSDADVLCVQELWTDDDFDALRDGLAAEYPYVYRHRTSNDETLSWTCNPFDTFMLDRCVKRECEPYGVSAFECVANQCKARYDELDDECKLCLAANVTSPWRCAAWGAARYAWDGHNGLAVFSRSPIDDAAYTAFDTALIQRGVITASIEGYQVQCTHLTADLATVPYPEGLTATSWNEEHREQARVMAQLAGDAQCTVLLGDLNAGPPDAGIVGELEDNFYGILEQGYEDLWATPVCTMCDDNPLTDSASVRIDHALFRNCPDSLTPGYARRFDAAIELDVDDASVESKLSDHYGLAVSLPAAP